MAEPTVQPLEQEAAETAPRPPGPPGHRSILRLVLQALAVTVVLGLLSLLVWRLITSQRGANLVAAIRHGNSPPAPGFRLPVIWPHDNTWPAPVRRALADGHISPPELRGHPAILNFWASWCIPCKDEAPRLTASARAHSGKVAFLGIDVQDFRSDARRFLRRSHTNYVSARDGSGSTYDRYGLTGVPETYYLDSRGRIVAHVAGEVSRRELEQGIAQALEASR